MSESIQLWHGDCLELMKTIPDKSVDAIICDLPYEVLKKGRHHAQWDKMLPLDQLWEQYKRAIKDSGAIILFGQGMFTAKLMMSNPKMWRYNLIWKKGNRVSCPMIANKRPLPNHEDILVFYKRMPTYNPQMQKGNVNHSVGRIENYKNLKLNCYGDFKRTNVKQDGLKYPKSVLVFERDYRDFYHPTQKPVSLIEYLIKTYSNEGDLILYNTAGSMTTAIAAINTNRRCICIEKDDHYFEIGSERVRKHLEQKKQMLF